LKIVLIVDDEESFLRSLTEGLSTCSEKFRVLTAHNGEEALRVLQLTDVSLLVTDLLMPIVSGYELIRRVRSDYPWIPIIVMSAHLDDESESRLRELGVTHFLEKPLDFEDVARRIGEKVSSSSGQNEEALVP
jgi:DNA-binding response OmpR family regulator